MSHLLSILLVLPAIGAVTILFLPDARWVRWTALGTTLITFLFSLCLLLRFGTHSPGTYYAASHGIVQLVERAALVPSLHVFYLVGIDGLSLPLILLTTFIFPLAGAASWKIDKSLKAFLSLLLLLETTILGVFLSLDLVLFFLFIEFSLLQIYLLIGIWGGPRKNHAMVTFLGCMLASSGAILIALIAIFFNTHSFDMMELPSLLRGIFGIGGMSHLPVLIFLLLMFAIFMRMAAVPLHFWFLEAQAQAPTAVNMILAALMLKIGGYAIFRVGYPCFPDVARHLWLPVALVGTFSILYAALCSVSQNDFKKLLAYNSVSQMGFVTLGAAMLTPSAINGAIFLMIAHGICSAMMFFIAGVLSDRAQHGDLTRFGGLASTMPRFFGLSLVGFFSIIGVPCLCGFVGEILILLGIFQALRPDALLFTAGFAFRGTILSLAVLAMIGLVVNVGCMLKTLQRIFFGPERPEQKDVPDVDQRETTILASLAAMAVLLGILPSVFVFSMTGKAVASFFDMFDKISVSTTRPASDVSEALTP